MSYNGSGTFVINSTGQPVVTGTVISSSTFNSLTADLGTGLSTAITKDGQTTTTAKIPFAQGLSAAVASNFAAGTVGAPSIYLSTDTTTGLYRIGANNDGFAISGVKLLDLGSALVGITGALTVSTTLNVTGVATLGNGAILGTPASGTVTNLTGTASININGTVGATTPTTGAFTSGTFSTTLGVTGAATFSVTSTPSVLNATGLGLGVTPSAWQTTAGSTALQFLGSALYGYRTTDSLWVQNAFFDGTAWKYYATAAASRIEQASGTVSLYVAASGSANAAITWITALSSSITGAVTIPGTLGVTGGITQSGSVVSSFTNTGTNYTIQAINSNGGTPNGINMQYTGADPNTNGQSFLACATTIGGSKFFAFSNGGLANFSANNQNLSDLREKKNIALAGSYIDKICAIPVKTFLYNDQTDSDLNLGVIAQDVEAIAPELITQSDWGIEGAPKIRKSIYQTDLQYALMKCIQEQQVMITSLTARLAALEAK